jgi:rubrerythrin
VGWKQLPGSEKYECRTCRGGGWLPLVTPVCPRCGATASAIVWIGGIAEDVNQPANEWRCRDCGHEWEWEPTPS